MKKTYHVLFYLLLISHLIYPASIEEVLSKYHENMKKLKSVQGRLLIMVKTGETYNHMKMDYVSLEKKVYIKSKPPFSFILVSNGEKAHFYSSRDKTVWLYYPGQYKQALEDPLQKKRDFLRDVLELEKIGEEYVGWKKLDVYEGRPIAGNQFVSKFRLWIDDQTGLLHRMESYDLHGELISRMDMKKYRQFNGVWLNLKNQNWTKTDKEIVESSSEFKDIEVNVEIEDSFFDFKIPEGAKIKDLTKMILKKDEKK